MKEAGLHGGKAKQGHGQGGDRLQSDPSGERAQEYESHHSLVPPWGLGLYPRSRSTFQVKEAHFGAVQYSGEGWHWQPNLVAAAVTPGGIVVRVRRFLSHSG